MEERKFISLKKEEYGVKEYVKRDLGKGRISRLNIEYTPVGEKIIIHTSTPGLIIGRGGEKIENLTENLKKRFKLENPHVEIIEIENPLFDAQLVADDIALSLERYGNLKFKVIAYKKLQDIMKAGALGCEIRLSGKLPSDRAKSWRFAEGYLKKSGEPKKEVDRAQAVAITKLGVIGVNVAIMPPEGKIYDKIDIDDKIKEKIKQNIENLGKIEIKKETEKSKDKKTEKVKGKRGRPKKEKDSGSEELKKEKTKEINKEKE